MEVIIIQRCAVYVRVSTEMKAQKSSIAHQKNFFENYIRERNWQLFKVYEDIESGMSVKKRNGLTELIKDSEKGAFDILLTKSISRFARNTLEGLKYIRELKQKDIRFITIEDAFDSFEYDEFMFTLLLSMAQKESEKTSQRIKFGKNQRAKRGLYNGSHPPYGYKKEGEDVLMPAGDITTEVVKKIFRLYAEGWGFYKIAKHLNGKGYATPSMVAKKSNSNDVWHQSTIRNILTNEVYIGNMVQNKSKTKDLLNGIRDMNLEDEYIRIDNTHEAVIDSKTFYLVQQILKERSIKKSSGSKHLFTDILYCGECGGRMHYKKKRASYLCGKVNKLGKKYCIGSYINEGFLRDEIERKLEEIIYEKVNLYEFNKKLEKETKKIQSHDELYSLDSQIENTLRKKKRLLEIYIDTIITKQEYSLKNLALQNELNLLQEKKKRLESELDKDRQNIIRSYNELYEYMKLDNMVINKFIKKIIVYNDGIVRVEYRFGKSSK